MNDPKAFDTSAASGAGFQSLLSDPLALATKPAVIFKFASSVSDFFCLKFVDKIIIIVFVTNKRNYIYINRCCRWSCTRAYRPLGTRADVYLIVTMESVDLVR